MTCSCAVDVLQTKDPGAHLSFSVPGMVVPNGAEGSPQRSKAGGRVDRTLLKIKPVGGWG